MTLGFSTKFADGTPTQFKGKIMASLLKKAGLAWNPEFPPKLHTIRDDPHNRWKPGMKIHFATGVRSPRRDDFAHRAEEIWQGDVRLDLAKMATITQFQHMKDKTPNTRSNGFIGMSDERKT